MLVQSKPLHLRSLQNHASNVFFFLFVSLSYFIYLFFTFGKWRELQSSVPGTLLYMNNQWPFDRLLIIDHNKKQKRTRRKDPTIRTEMDVVLGSNARPLFHFIFPLVVFRVTFSSGVPRILLHSVMPEHLSPRLSLSPCRIVNNDCFSSFCVLSQASDHIVRALCHSAESSASKLRPRISTYCCLWSSQHSFSVWGKEVCWDRHIML